MIKLYKKKFMHELKEWQFIWNLTCKNSIHAKTSNRDPCVQHYAEIARLPSRKCEVPRENTLLDILEQ